jgi:pSer/pThr/pTyr-binding forkhead associated (FHA) protein
MAPTLIALTDGPDLVMARPVLLVGRHAECDVQLHSAKVSRRHCVLALIGERLVVRDLGSTNGVRINGAAVDEGDLRPGDEVAIGNFRYLVSGDGGPGRPPPDVDEDERLERTDRPVPLRDARESQVLMAEKPPDDAHDNP